MGIPQTEYVRTDDGLYLAYQVVGSGTVDIAIAMHPTESNVDLIWDDPDWRPFLDGLANLGRLILHDPRGLGASSRDVPPPTLEQRVADQMAVLDAVDARRPILASGGMTGSMHALFAATHPARTAGFVWNTPSCRAAWAPDYPWGGGAEEYQAAFQRAGIWGTTSGALRLARLRAAERAGIAEADLAADAIDEERVKRYARIIRNTASPDVAQELIRIIWETDVRGILPAVTAPTVLAVGEEDAVFDGIEEARHIASLMPNAELRIGPGRSGLAVEPYLAAVRDLAGIAPPPVEVETILATVLFTDIVDSTARQATLGDRAWKSLVLAHHSVVRDALARWRGLENDTAGDGFFATFDGPARAIRCALEIRDRVRDLGLEVRAGVHTGECEEIDGKRSGLAVSIGARVTALAPPSQVYVSQTVRDLVAGSRLSFEDAGLHELKGVPGTWRLYRVA